MSRASSSAERPLAGAVLAVLLGSAAACGVADAAATTIEMHAGNRFEPSTITVDAGTEVVWHNASTSVHTVTTDSDDVAVARVPDGADAWDGGRIEPSGSLSHRFDVPGVYVFGCQIHADRGMVGVVRVQR